MRIYEYSKALKLKEEHSIALGFFDGVHLGHRALISQTVADAKARGIKSAVFTFYSEEAMPKSDRGRLYSTEKKLSIFEELGIDTVVIARFSDVCDLSPSEFVQGILVSSLLCRTAVCGKDFRFGKAASGNVQALSSLLAECGARCIALEDVTLKSGKVSTSAIKEFLRTGRLQEANEMLGAPYSIDARVEHGRGVGHSLGFPTLNTSLGYAEGILKKGVYSSCVTIDGLKLRALTNVGTCPTFEKRDTHAETFILDYDGNLYEKKVNIALHSFLREEMRFDSPEALTEQIKKDIERINF